MIVVRVELKPEYFVQAARQLAHIEASPGLFDTAAA